VSVALLAALPRCPLRAALGLPCPTCGTLRGLLALLAGEPVIALAYNPGVWLAGLGLTFFVARGLWIEWRTGRFPVPQPRDRRARQRLAFAVGLLVAANWGYVIWHEATLVP
jgi:hypothetical protein